jgi:hypothetical protein
MVNGTLDTSTGSPVAEADAGCLELGVSVAGAETGVRGWAIPQFPQKRSSGAVCAPHK